MFDKLILISEGHALFSGYAIDAMEYFNSLGFVSQIPMNPADFMLDLATGMTGHDITLPKDLERVAKGILSPSSEDGEGRASNQDISKLGATMQDRTGSPKQMTEDIQKDLILKVCLICMLWVLKCVLSLCSCRDKVHKTCQEDHQENHQRQVPCCVCPG